MNTPASVNDRHYTSQENQNSMSRFISVAVRSKIEILYLIITCLVSLPSGGQAQNIQHIQAERQLENLDYVAARDIYENILLTYPGDKKAMQNIILCYNKLNNIAQAEMWLARLCEHEPVDPRYVKMYAEVLTSRGNYTESITWYKKYVASSGDKIVEKIIASYETIDRFFTDSSLYKIENLAINSRQSDFAPAFYKDGIVFCSSRTNTQSNAKQSAYIDLYALEDMNSSPENLGKTINTPFHEGPAVFSKNFDTLYFTRNVYSNKRALRDAQEEVVQFKIVYSVLKDGQWQKAKDIAVGDNQYSMGHPALSPDGKLYFVSDMPGGYGGTDLYYMQLDHGQWASPVNLGPLVNTAGNEMFPFIDDVGNLYFASSGHAGLGGLDIFSSLQQNGSFSAPKNMGYPINSSYDDFGLIVKNNATGFFSSNRGSLSQDDNIYSFTATDATLTVVPTEKKGKL